MKFCLFIFLTVFCMNQGFSQNEPPAFVQSKEFPAFELQQANNVTLTPAKIKKNVPTAIIFFSPSCEHCQHQMEWMLKRTHDLRKYQFVMATYQPIEELTEFNKKYQLSKHPNIYTGRDTKYFFPPFYQIHNFPFLAFYDKNRKLITTFEGNMSVDNIIKNFNKSN